MSSTRRTPVPGTTGRWLAAAAGVLLLAVAPAVAGAQETTEVRSARRDLGQAERLEVDVEYAAGRITIARADRGYLYQSYLRYDASRFEPVAEWSRDDAAGRLRLGIEGAEDLQFLRWGEGGGLNINLDALRGLEDLDEASSALELRLSRSVPTDLDLSIGAAESTLQLGGVPITSLSVETGASDTRIAFDRPNPARMGRLAIEAGAASFRTSGLGNARFSRLTVEGGVGDVRLDFTGDWVRDARATVDVGLGSLQIIVPEDLGVRIRRESFLASFDVPAGFRSTDDGYRSDNWSTAEHQLTLDLSAAFGSVEVTLAD